MQKHYAKPASRLAIETKDASGSGNVDVKSMSDAEFKQTMGEFMGAVGEFMKTNDERLTQIAKKGVADVITEEKVGRINKVLDGMERFNQDLTKMQTVQEEIKSIDKRFDQIETMIQRSGASSEEKKSRVQDWARGVLQATTLGVVNLAEAERKVLQDIETEYKALNVSTNTEGGYLAPVEFVREIIKAETLLSPVRSLARVRTTGFRSIELPKRTGQFAAQWVSEQGTKSETTGLTYGVDEITTHELYALIDVTNQMIEDGVFDIENEIETEASEQFAVAEGTAFVNGSGNGQPEGFMTNSSVASANSGSATTIADVNGQADGLLKGLKYGLKTAYAANATWVMNRTTMGSVRTLKDGNNNYIWQPGIAQGRPNTIDGDPYVEMPDMPSEGAGLFPIAYGDFRRAYTWVDRLAMEMLRDPYTQATSGKIRHILRKRVAGKVVLAEAIRKLKCSA